MHHHLALRNKIIIMLSVMASLFLVALDQMVFSTSLGKIVEEFNAYSSLSWVVTAYLITTTVTVPIAGKLSDLFGRRIMLLIGIAVFVAGSLFGGMSGDITQLIFWRAIQGVGGGIITANAFSIVGDLFAARERGKWQGLIGAVFGISSVAGPLIGGFLTESHQILGLVTNWRWTILMNVPIGIIAFIVIFIYCPLLKHDKHPHIDYVGAGLLAFALSMLVLAIDNTKSIFAGLMDGTGLDLVGLRVIMFSLIVIAVIAFLYVEKRAKEPILPMYFFKNKNFVLIMMVAMLFGSAFLGSILYLTQFNQQVFGASPTESGLMLLPMVAGLTLTSIGTGQLMSRTGKYKLYMQIGMAVATLSILSLLVLTPETGYPLEAVIMVFLGLGMGVGMPVINLVVQNEFKQSDIGAATSSSQLFRGLGSTIGIALFSAVLTAGIAVNVTDMQNSKYIQSLKSSPAASKIGSFDDSNTLLTLNMPSIKNKINTESEKAFTKLPPMVQEKVTDEFKNSQSEYSNIVTHAFSNGMHNIFLIAAVIMFMATVIISFITEKPLRTAKASETPGII